MKKALFSFALIICCYGYGFATNKINIQVQQQDSKVKAESKKKVERYDFSLFKFLTPKKTTIKKDTTNLSKEQINNHRLDEKTTFHQEKPLVFFKFS